MPTNSKDPSAPHPGELLSRLLAERDWTQGQLATITGHSRQTIAAIVRGRSGVSPDMAVALAAAFGTDPEHWMRADAEYQLTLATTDAAEVQHRAQLYQCAPIRAMQKRGWIKAAETAGELEEELKRFFGGDISEGVSFSIAARSSAQRFAPSDLSPADRAWCFRARQLAAATLVGAFSPKKLGALARQLRKIAAYPQEVTRLPGVFADYGIAFVIVEPLGRTSIDGAAFWIDGRPVIAVSVRIDRIDAFWFTVMHEFAHIRNGDALSVDRELLFEIEKGVVSVLLAEEECEQRANADAAEMLVPQRDLDSFVGRMAPLFSATRLVQFAHRIKMHPGIIVGQLQHRGEVGYSAHRSFLVKVRSLITEVALTDGWGQVVGEGIV